MFGKNCLLWFGEIQYMLNCVHLDVVLCEITDGLVCQLHSTFYHFFSTVTHRLRFISVAPQRPQGGDLSVSRISVHNAMSGLQTRDIETPCFCSSLPLSIPTYLWHPTVRMLSISPALLISSVFLMSFIRIFISFPWYGNHIQEWVVGTLGVVARGQIMDIMSVSLLSSDANVFEAGVDIF